MAKLTEVQSRLLSSMKDDDGDPTIEGTIIDHATAEPLEKSGLIEFQNIWHFGAISNVYVITEAGRRALEGDGS